MTEFSDGSTIDSVDAGELGALLVRNRVITQDQLDRAMRLEKEVGGNLPSILVKLGFTTEKDLVEFFGRTQRIPVVDLATVTLNRDLIRAVPRSIIEKHQMLPLSMKDDILTVCVFDPYDIEGIEEIQIAFDCRVKVQLATRSQILKAIAEAFQERKPTSSPPDRGRLEALAPALIPVLLEKEVISMEDLERKAKELGLIE